MRATPGFRMKLTGESPNTHYIGSWMLADKQCLMRDFMGSVSRRLGYYSAR